MGNIIKSLDDKDVRLLALVVVEYNDVFDDEFDPPNNCENVELLLRLLFAPPIDRPPPFDPFIWGCKRYC